METFEEFIAAVEREEAQRHDAGLGYDIGGGILRALHRRIVALEPAEAEAPPPEPAQPGDA